MKVTIKDGSAGLRERLAERLRQAEQLRCAEHQQQVTEVTIFGRENGWFDSRWTTCCEMLQQQAAAIVKSRC